jgi:hypothetical protein
MFKTGLDVSLSATHDLNVFNYPSRQHARIVFGLVLLAGAVRLIASSLVADPRDHSSTGLLAWTWACAFAAALLTRVATYRVASQRSSLRLLAASLAIPAAGVALLLPISIHALWFASRGSIALEGFDGWVSLSMLCSGLAHLVFLALLVQRAIQLAYGRPTLAVGWIYLWPCIAGSLPFPVVPSIIVAITGLPILPLVSLMKPLADHERSAHTLLPRAQLGSNPCRG